MKIDMNKLYALHIVVDAESDSRVIACSNSLDKLRQIVFTPDNTFHRNGDPNDKTLMMHTTDGVYPKYLFREIPYVV